MRKRPLTKHSLIAILDDEHSFAQLALVTLKEIGFQNVVAFETTEHFCHWPDLKNAEIIFIDVNLNEMNGLTILPWLKTKVPSARIIIFSGDTRKQVVSEAINLGACSFLSKLNLDKNIRVLFNKWNVNYPLS
ncbi:MAG: response regulator [Thalassotalea sp.]|nr:response regulator [Thalassotalea sp.]